jgi:hypothetical protein
MSPPKARRIVIAVYDGVSLLDLAGPCRASFGSQQDDPRAKNVALLRRGGSHSRLKRRTILRRQPDFRSLEIIPMSNHESALGETGYWPAGAATLAP